MTILKGTFEDVAGAGVAGAHLVIATLEPVVTDTGIRVKPADVECDQAGAWSIELEGGHAYSVTPDRRNLSWPAVTVYVPEAGVWDVKDLEPIVGNPDPSSATFIAYEDVLEAAQLLAGHIAAVDPHGDRAYTNQAIANLINSAPGVLDTLGEIAAALQADESALGALTLAVNARLIAANNLSDLADKPTARTNLGLGSAATHAHTDYDPAGAAAARLLTANNLSDLADKPTARTNLGLGSAATHAHTEYAAAGQVQRQATILGTQPPQGSSAASTPGWISVFVNGGADGNWIQWEVALAAGTYTIRRIYNKGNNVGFVGLSIDGAATIGLVDTYSAGSLPNSFLADLTGVTIAADGIHTVRSLVSGKNASSTAFFQIVNAIHFTRTGA